VGNFIEKSHSKSFAEAKSKAQRRHQVGDLLVADLKTSRNNCEILAFNEAPRARNSSRKVMIVRASCATGTRKPKTIGPTLLLRARREQPCDRSAADERDELAPHLVRT